MYNPNRFKWGNTKCAYCGKSPAPEEEHVIGRCFFPKPIPSGINFVVVAACKECNHGAGSSLNGDEDYVSGFFSLMFNAQYHPNALSRANGPVARSMESGKGEGRNLLKNVRVADRVSASGLWTGNELRAQPDWIRIHRVLEKIVRGLYYHETGHVLPSDHVVKVNVQKLLKSGKIDLDLFLNLWRASWRLPGLTHIQRQDLGDFTFAWWAVLNAAANSSTWFISFYDGAMAAIVTVQPPQDEGLMMLSGSEQAALLTILIIGLIMRGIILIRRENVNG